MLLRALRDDPGPGVHSAAEWALRRWGHEPEVRELRARAASANPPAGRLWFVNRQGLTMAVVKGPVEFVMGSPGHEKGRDSGETLHRVRIDRTFAIATEETTTAQFLAFDPTISK